MSVRWQNQYQRLADVLSQRAERLHRADHGRWFGANGSCPICIAVAARPGLTADQRLALAQVLGA